MSEIEDKVPVQREQWNTRLGVILAVAGSAVGLGNFLRFPGQAAENGGGAFMIPYFISFILIGLPICWIEWIIGKSAGTRGGYHSAPGIFFFLSRKKWCAYAGAMGLLVPVGVYMYYIVIESWCLAYAIKYLFGAINLGNDPSRYAENSSLLFSSLAGQASDGFFENSFLKEGMFWWLIVLCINMTLILKGLTKGIEKFCTFALPLMAVCAIITLIRVLTLGTPNPELPDQNVLNGLGYMWNPKSLDAEGPWYNALLDSQTWVAAAGQIFFSLSVGFGIIINYSSYLKEKEDLVLTGTTASATNQFFEVCLGGLITIPAAFIFLGVAGTTGGTFGLGFQTLPVVFEYMPAGNFFGFLWFFMLFLAGITSSLSMLQPAVAFFKEAFRIESKTASIYLTILTALGSSFVLYFSKGSLALDTLDFWIGTVGIYLLAFLQVVMFLMIFGAKNGIDYANETGKLNIPKVFVFIITYITPTYLLAVFLFWSVQSLPAKFGEITQGGSISYSVLLILVLLGFFAFFIKRAIPHWESRMDQ